MFRSKSHLANLIRIVMATGLSAIGVAAMPGDLDGDHDLDCADLKTFAACMEGPSAGGMTPDCTAFDVSASGNVDLADFAAFQVMFDTCAAPPGFTQIKTPDELFAIRANPQGSYILCTDLDLAGYDVRPVCSCGFEFEGVFEGNGKHISNLRISRMMSDCVGLFGASSGTIRNLILENPSVNGDQFVGALVGRNERSGNVENVTIVTGAVTGVSYVGGLVGMNEGIVTDSRVEATVTARRMWNGWGSRIGGVAGCNERGTICRTSSSGIVDGYALVGGLAGCNGTATLSAVTIESWSDATVYGKIEVGGLLGRNDGYSCVIRSIARGFVFGGNSPVGGLVGFNFGLLEQCYATGEVAGGTKAQVGGLVGANGLTIEQCYAIGLVTGGEGAGGAHGGLVGFALVGPPYDPQVTDSYWDVQTTEQANSAGGDGELTVRMKSLSTFRPQWNITYYGGEVNSAWELRGPDGHNYPQLSWELGEK